MGQKRRLLFQLQLAFFGLTINYRKSLFQQLHEITYYGGGGYEYYTVYNMPIWLRKLTYNQIVNAKKKESESYKKSDNNIDLANPDKSKIPPNYISPP